MALNVELSKEEYAYVHDKIMDYDRIVTERFPSDSITRDEVIKANMLYGKLDEWHKLSRERAVKSEEETEK